MDERAWMAERFEAHRAHLRSVAYRMLGSLSDAEDAVQEAWLRLSRSESAGIENLGGWLTTVVSRVCLDMLRSRTSRREEPLEAGESQPVASRAHGGDPQQEAAMAESVGLALLVVLEALTPAERLAFVLHDMFAVPFDEIAPIVGRSEAAARQLASRARRRVRGGSTASGANLTGQRAVVDAFLAALRSGDFEGLLALLDPDLVVRSQVPGDAPGTVREVRGARTWASSAMPFAQALRSAQPALVDGVAGVVLAPRGKLLRALRLTIERGKIAAIEVIIDPEQLRGLEVAILDA